MNKLKNKNCFITGAGSGIGKALASGLAKEGMNIYLSDINLQRLLDLKERLENYEIKVFTGLCDVRNCENFVKIAKDFHSKLGEIDLLINNAGISTGGFAESLILEDWKKILEVNLWSVINSIKAFLPRMIKNRHGHLVNVASAAGIVGEPFNLHYVASKFAIVGISEGLYSELSDRGIDISVICPTAIKTNIFNKFEMKFPKDYINPDNQQHFSDSMEKFKNLFSKEYNRKGLTPEEAANRYIKGIKKSRLYIFDKKILPLAMFVKGFSKRWYQRILKNLGNDYLTTVENVLSSLDIKYNKEYFRRNIL